MKQNIPTLNKLVSIYKKYNESEENIAKKEINGSPDSYPAPSAANTCYDATCHTTGSMTQM